MQRGVVTPHSKSCPLYSNFQEVYCIRVFFLLIKLLTEISIIAIWWTITRKRWELQNVRPMFIWMVCIKMSTNTFGALYKRFIQIDASSFYHITQKCYIIITERHIKTQIYLCFRLFLIYFNLRAKLWYYVIKFLLN